nr:hypothetical protein [Micromonospora acroterricola]
MTIEVRTSTLPGTATALGSAGAYTLVVSDAGGGLGAGVPGTDG